jgi:hypothetical protein
MKAVYRFELAPPVPIDNVEASLLLAIWSTESLHGADQVRLDASHYLDLGQRVCVIDASTVVGRDLSRLFAGSLRREFGDDAFEVVRIDPETHNDATGPVEAAGAH